jgi:hypothetical protein
MITNDKRGDNHDVKLNKRWRSVTEGGWNPSNE